MRIQWTSRLPHYVVMSVLFAAAFILYAQGGWASMAQPGSSHIAAGSQCLPLTAPCSADGDCCSGSCYLGQCTSCLSNGQACNGDGDCCSDYCDPGTGQCKDEQ
jgi:hypothetical protein